MGGSLSMLLFLLSLIIGIGIIIYQSKERKFNIMKFCSKCGSQINDNDNFCPMCGTPVVKEFSNQSYYNHNNYLTHNTDENSVGLNILSFCIPIVGLVLYIVLKDKEPIKAKGCGKWTLISFIINLILLPFMFIF